MAAPIALRDDFDGPGLRRLAKATKDAAQARRLLALAEIYEGGSRTDAARIGGVTLQIVRDWGVRFNQHGPDRLINRTAPGNRPKLNEDQRLALARMVESGPIPAIHGVVRWRRKDLACWLFDEFRIAVDETTVGRALRALGDEFRIAVDETTVGRALRALGFAKLSARPRHYAQNEREREAFKKACPPSWRRSEPGCQTAPR
jgi:transposase